jgi:hypothetical protein
MELTILERLTLLGILPESGNFVTMKILQRLRMALGFTEEEIAKHNLVVTENNVKWENEEAPVNIPLGKVAREEIVKALEKLDAAGKVEARHLSLYEKFSFGED